MRIYFIKIKIQQHKRCYIQDVPVFNSQTLPVFLPVFIIEQKCFMQTVRRNKMDQKSASNESKFLNEFVKR